MNYIYFKTYKNKKYLNVQTTCNKINRLKKELNVLFFIILASFNFKNPIKNHFK